MSRRPPRSRPSPKKALSLRNYDDGKVRVERNVRLLSDNQVVNHGKYTEYYRNGQKFAEGNFDSGVHDGPWSYWHDNGQLAKTVTFKKGAPEGAWEVFRADGTLQAKKGYKAGKRDGAWITYYEDGKTPKIEQNFADGKLSGPRKTFYRQRQTSSGSRASPTALLDGVMTEWDEAGRKLAEATFAAGKLNGKLSRWSRRRQRERAGLRRQQTGGQALTASSRTASPDHIQRR